MDRKDISDVPGLLSSDSDDDIPLAQLKDIAAIDEDAIPLSELFCRNITSTPKNDNDNDQYEDDDFIDYDSDADPEFQIGVCEVTNCKEEVWSACENCSILVCYDHCIEDVESCSEHGKVLSRQREEGKNKEDGASRRQEEVHEVPVDESKLEQEQVKGNLTEEQREEKDQLSKTVKRKKETARGRFKKKKQMKREKEAKKYTVREGCGAGCRRKMKCRESFSEEDQKSINAHYLSLDYAGRKEFVYQSVFKEECKRRTTHSKKKNFSYQYTLKHCSVRKQVCRSFFLGTLGLHPKNDWAVTHFLRETPVGSQPDDQHFLDGRGGQKPRKYDHEEVIAHIEKYNPTISHYRSAHAPYRRYLPSEVTVLSMYKDFSKEKKNGMSYDTFYKIFKTTNISMAILGHEECEICERHEIHKKNCRCETSCDISQYLCHKKRYTKARIEYKKDSQDIHDSQEIYTSADLQKVIMLPQMECFKEVIFTRRLTVFNETFAELGAGKRDYAAVWHEAICGRQDEDLASAFYEYILKMRDMKKVVIWLDNCGAQNKNWSLYTMLTHLVNSDAVTVDTLELKYLEKGHTFMAADSKHKQIQQQMKASEKVYDFDDFKTCVTKAKCEVIEMQVSSFREWKSGMSPHTLKKTQKRPYLEKMVHVKFMRGSEDIHFKKSFDDPFESAKFLKASFELKRERLMNVARGIPGKMKEDIIKKLTPLMPRNRCPFWENLPVNDKVKDLCHEHERRTSQ